MSKLNFNAEFIPMILAGRKTMTRRLVKEGEWCVFDDISSDVLGVKKELRWRWQVGRKYAVCVEGKQVWYCSHHNVAVLGTDNWFNMCRVCAPGYSDHLQKELTLTPSNEQRKMLGQKPLFVEVTGIRKEKLLDISEKDALNEGFTSEYGNPKYVFLKKFFDINKIKYKLFPEFKGEFGYYSPEAIVPDKYAGNIYVWVLSFKVVE